MVERPEKKMVWCGGKEKRNQRTAFKMLKLWNQVYDLLVILPKRKHIPYTKRNISASFSCRFIEVNCSNVSYYGNSP